MDYRFEFQIETEEGEILMEGWTYIGTIGEYGGSESIEQEVSKYLRIFKKKLESEADERAETEKEAV